MVVNHSLGVERFYSWNPPDVIILEVTEPGTLQGRRRRLELGARLENADTERENITPRESEGDI